jgi:thioredoxin-like negative regulator of GroEL
LPVLEQVSAEYEGDVTFVAVAARSDVQTTAERAGEWLPSGRVKWAFDPEERLWQLFGARGTPTTIVIDDAGRVVGGWPGALGEDNLRAVLDGLTSLGG